MKTILLTALATLTTASMANVTPFTETFEGGVNGWLQGSFGPPVYSTTGSIDASAYISSTADLNSAGPFGFTIFRGQDDFDASGDAFVGDYLAGGINMLTLNFRHNAGQDLGIALRVSGSNNFPGFAVELPGLVASDQWVSLSFELRFLNPLVTIEGPPSLEAFNQVMEAVGNIQLSVDRPDGLDTPLVVDFDLDNVSITPAPASLAMFSIGGLFASRRKR